MMRLREREEEVVLLKVAGHYGAHTVDTASPVAVAVASQQVEGGQQGELGTLGSLGSLRQGGVVGDGHGGHGVGEDGLGNDWQSCSLLRLLVFVGHFLVNVGESLNLLVDVGLGNISSSIVFIGKSLD